MYGVEGSPSSGFGKRFSGHLWYCSLSSQLFKALASCHVSLSSVLALPVFEILCLRHFIPLFFTIQSAARPPPPLSTVNIVKNHPLPITSTSGCNTATTTAESAHLVMLPLAAAVLGLVGNMSTNSALKVC